MGRWSQRRRAGGGGTPGNQMVLAFISGANTIDVEFFRPIPAGTINAQTVEIAPSANSPISIIQSDSKTLTYDFGLAVAGTTSLTYSGNDDALLTPQTIAVT